MGASSVISRRSLLAAPTILLLPAVRSSNGAGVAFPGQPGNPVGFAAEPGFNTGSNPNGAGNLAGQQPIGDGTSGTYLLVSGSAGAPTQIFYKDFSPSGIGQTNHISANGALSGGAVHDITFIGCRFTANTNNLYAPDCCVDMLTSGSYNITFSYCTFAPLTSVYAHPIPSTAWPSSSVGTGTVFKTTGSSADTYRFAYGVTYRDAISVGVPTGGTVTLDHCDLWGWGEGIGYGGQAWTTVNTYPANGQLNITDCWIHDCRIDHNNDDHTNGIIPTNSNGCSNVLFKHNTVSALGNTNAIAFGHLWSAPGIEPNGVVGQGVWDGARHYQFSDYIFYNGQPSAGDTFTLNGTTVTYVASGATGNQINIGGSLATTLRNTNTFLNASADAQISKCTYATNTTNRINIFFKDVSGDGNTYTVATSGTNLSVYWGNLIAPKVGGLDGFQYTALKGSTGVDPQGNLNPTVWQQYGVISYRNIQIINNHISGFNNMIDMGTGNVNSTGIVFTDNIISNYVMWLARLCYGGGRFNGPNGVNFAAMFNGTGNQWRRNVYQMYPGSGSSYDRSNAGKDGYYLWPDNTLNATDWTH